MNKIKLQIYSLNYKSATFTIYNCNTNNTIVNPVKEFIFE